MYQSQKTASNHPKIHCDITFICPAFQPSQSLRGDFQCKTSPKPTNIQFKTWYSFLRKIFNKEIYLSMSPEDILIGDVTFHFTFLISIVSIPLFQLLTLSLSLNKNWYRDHSSNIWKSKDFLLTTLRLDTFLNLSLIVCNNKLPCLHYYVDPFFQTIQMICML